MTDLEYNKTVKLFENRLIGYVYKNTNDIELSKDLTQETFIKLWDNRIKITVEKSKSWLFTVIKNGMINHIKREKKFEYINPEHDVKDNINSVDFDTKSIILDELKKLDKRSQRLILLRDVHKMSYSELGDRLNLSESQVKVYLFRTRKKLKDRLKSIVVN
jgi:RNA polymerase sigma-70 factor (ECF subfamily)